MALTGVVCACATMPARTVDVTTEASGSEFFSLGAPAVSKATVGQHIAGRVCRLSRSTRLSPLRIRVEHLTGPQRIADVGHAYVPEIFSARDQTCADYHSKVAWTLAPGDVIRTCFDRGTPCPAQAASKAAVKAPATP